MTNANAKELRLLFWESTARCNLACAHCRRLETPSGESPDDLTTAEARGLIDSAAELGKPVFIFSGGEPLLRHDWHDLADYARQVGLPVALATNGTLVDREAAGEIARAGFTRVSVSLDAAEPAMHDAFRGAPGAFQAALAGVGHLRAAGVAVQINSTICLNTLGQLDGLYALAEKAGAAALHLFVLVPVGCGLELKDGHQLTGPQVRGVLEWVVRRQAEGTIELKATCAPQYARIARLWLAANRQHPGAGRVRAMLRGRGCLAGVGVIFISHSGEVFPCGYLPVSCGNIRRQALREIWEGSPVLARLGDCQHLTGRCGLCDYKSVCAGCRARAYSATGDYLSEEPLCAF